MIKLLFIKYLDPHAHKKGTKPDQTWGFFFIFIKTKIITQSHCSTEEIWDLCMLSIQTDHIKRQSYLSNKSYVCMQILVFWQELYWWKSPHIWRDIQKNVTGKKSGSGYLSPCGGMGRGPWPLGRSILGDSGGRPGILLSRPTKRSECDAWGTERADCNEISGHSLNKELKNNCICSDIRFLEGFSNGQ